MPDTEDYIKKWEETPIRSRKKPGVSQDASKNETESRKNVAFRFLDVILIPDLIRYLSVSAGTALVYFSTIYGLHELAGLSPTPAFSAAYVVGLAAHFLGNKFFSFRSRALSPAPLEALKYGLLILINYCITLAFVYLSMQLLGSFYWGTVLAPPATFVVSYPFMKYLVFSSGRRSAFNDQTELAGKNDPTGNQFKLVRVRPGSKEWETFIECSVHYLRAYWPRKFEKLTEEEHKRKYGDSLRTLESGGKRRLYLFFKNEICVGFSNSYFENRTIFIAEFHVFKYFQRRGYGRELLARLIQEAIEEDAGAISIEVDKELQPANSFWESFHFLKNQSSTRNIFSGRLPTR